MTRSPNEILEQEFLQTRSKLLEVAAFFDRLGEAGGNELDAPKLALLKEACDLLCDGETEKAARLQLLFSREYDSTWRDKMSV